GRRGYPIRDANSELALLSSDSSPTAAHVLRFRQTYGGHPLLFHDLTVELDRNLNVTAIIGGLAPTPVGGKKTHVLSSTEAARIAAAQLRLTDASGATVAPLMALGIVVPGDLAVPITAPLLVYYIKHSTAELFLNARTGAVVAKLSRRRGGLDRA